MPPSGSSASLETPSPGDPLPSPEPVEVRPAAVRDVLGGIRILTPDEKIERDRLADIEKRLDAIEALLAL